MGLPVPLRRPGDTTRHCQDLLSPGEAPPPELVDRDSLRVLNPCRLPVHDSIFVVLRQRVEGGERASGLNRQARWRRERYGSVSIVSPHIHDGFI